MMEVWFRWFFFANIFDASIKTQLPTAPGHGFIPPATWRSIGQWTKPPSKLKTNRTQRNDIDTGWWFQPIWKILVKLWIISPKIGVKIKNIWNLKPPSRTSFRHKPVNHLWILGLNQPGNQPPGGSGPPGCHCGSWPGQVGGIMAAGAIGGPQGAGGIPTMAAMAMAKPYCWWFHIWRYNQLIYGKNL